MFTWVTGSKYKYKYKYKYQKKFDIYCYPFFLIHPYPKNRLCNTKL